MEELLRLDFVLHVSSIIVKLENVILRFNNKKEKGC